MNWSFYRSGALFALGRKPDAPHASPHPRKDICFLLGGGGSESILHCRSDKTLCERKRQSERERCVFKGGREGAGGDLIDCD